MIVFYSLIDFLRDYIASFVTFHRNDCLNSLLALFIFLLVLRVKITISVVMLKVVSVSDVTIHCYEV
jgi:hypothetical protein